MWEFYALRLDVLAEAAPNPAHVALAELEAAGLLRAVVTQNVDGLHRAAGSRDVIEVHGSLAQARCLGCDMVVARPALETLLAGGRLAIVNRESTPYDDRAAFGFASSSTPSRNP